MKCLSIKLNNRPVVLFRNSHAYYLYNLELNRKMQPFGYFQSYFDTDISNNCIMHPKDAWTLHYAPLLFFLPL